MIIETFIAASLIAAISLLGVFLFGQSSIAARTQKYVLPLAVGIFLGLVLFELIPETIAEAPKWGGVVIGFGFLIFYVLAHYLHRRYHALGVEACAKKGGATLLLIGDAVHNIADGIVLAGAFMISPVVGTAAAIGIALHEVPQEIVEFGVLLRAGYTKRQAAVRNLLSASSIFLGVLIAFVVAEFAAEWLWVVAAVAAGNLLYLAASDLLPRIHADGIESKNTSWTVGLIVGGFVAMVALLSFAHEQFPHGHDHAHGDNHTHSSDHEEHHDHEDEAHHDHETNEEEHHHENGTTHEEEHHEEDHHERDTSVQP